MKALVTAYLLAVFCLTYAKCVNWDAYRKQIEDFKIIITALRAELISYHQTLKPNLTEKLTVKRNESFDCAVNELREINAEAELAIEEAENDNVDVDHCVTAYKEEHKKLFELLAPELDNCVFKHASVIDELVSDVDSQITVSNEVLTRLDSAFANCTSTNEEEMEECIKQRLINAQILYKYLFPFWKCNNRGLEEAHTETAMNRIFFCNRIATGEIFDDAVANKENILQCIWDARPGIPDLGREAKY